MIERNKIYHGDSLEILKTFPDEYFAMCVTSPPYYQLRNYFAEGQLGQERTPFAYTLKLAKIFREVRRVLRSDGLFWLNMGDSRAGSGKGWTGWNGIGNQEKRQGFRKSKPFSSLEIKNKDLMEIPSMVATALQRPWLRCKECGREYHFIEMGNFYTEDGDQKFVCPHCQKIVDIEVTEKGWWLRSRIPWLKRNCLGSETRVYVKSQKGVMPMTVHDMVRLNPETIKLWNGKKWTQCVDFHKTEDVIKDTIKLELRSGETISCTKEHRWSTTRGLLPTSDLKIGDVLHKTTLPDTEYPDLEHLPDRIGRIMGLFLSEGSYLTKDDDAGVVFTFSEKETHLDEEIKQFALDYGGSHHSHTYDTGGKLMSVIHGKIPIATIKTFITNKGSKAKRLSNACWSRNNTFLRNLLDGYLEGDGHYEKENNRWRLGFCENDNLANDIRTLCARLGVSLRLKRGLCSATKGGKLYPIWRGQIRFNQDDHSTNDTCFKHKEDTEIIAIKKGWAAHYYDIGVEDEPHLFALASGVLTHNSMPESCKDRPSSATEYVFQFAKSDTCFYDLDAIRKPHSAANQADFEARAKRGTLGWGDRSNAKYQGDYNSAKAKEGRSRDEFHNPDGRQRRDSDSFFESWQGLWEEDGELLGLIVNPKGNKFIHFATYPEGLIEPLVKSSTSAFGYCQQCGAPFQRVTKKGEKNEAWKAACGADSQGEYGGVSEKWLKQDELGKNTYTGFNARWKKSQQNASDVKRRVLEGMAENNTIGWTPTCGCDVIGYSHKHTGINFGQSECSFVRENKMEEERKLHKEQAKKMYPDDLKAQKEYIRYMHDHGCIKEQKTLGWSPTCGCQIINEIKRYPSFICDDYSRRLAQEAILYAYAQYKPARGCILDPFMGSGTSAVVAKRHGLDYVGIDLNESYTKIAEKRVGEMV